MMRTLMIALAAILLMSGCHLHRVPRELTLNERLGREWSDPTLDSDPPREGYVASVNVGYLGNDYEAYGEEASADGVVFGGEVVASEWFRLGADVSYAKGDIYGVDLRHAIYTLNAKAYPFGATESPVQPYALLGYAMSWGSLEYWGQTELFTANGGAIGVGVDFLFPGTDIFSRAEYRVYDWSSSSDLGLDEVDQDSISLSIGVQF